MSIKFSSKYFGGHNNRFIDFMNKIKPEINHLSIISDYIKYIYKALRFFMNSIY